MKAAPNKARAEKLSYLSNFHTPQRAPEPLSIDELLSQGEAIIAALFVLGANEDAVAALELLSNTASQAALRVILTNNAFAI